MHPIILLFSNGQKLYKCCNYEIYRIAIKCIFNVSTFYTTVLNLIFKGTILLQLAIRKKQIWCYYKRSPTMKYFLALTYQIFRYVSTIIFDKIAILLQQLLCTRLNKKITFLSNLNIYSFISFHILQKEKVIK